MEGYPKEELEIRDLRKKDQFIIDDEFLDVYAKFVGIQAVGVYSSLCRRAGKDQKCWPSIKRIQKDLGIGRNSVINSIKKLEFWKIIKKTQIGRACSNRYWLIHKKSWREIDEESIKEFSEVCKINFSSLQDKLQQSQRETSNKGDKRKEIKIKEKFFSNEEKIEAYKNGKKWGEKPYFWDDPIVWKKSDQKLYVIENTGDWKKFDGKLEEIEWK